MVSLGSFIAFEMIKQYSMSENRANPAFKIVLLLNNGDGHPILSNGGSENSIEFVSHEPTQNPQRSKASATPELEKCLGRVPGIPQGVESSSIPHAFNLRRCSPSAMEMKGVTYHSQTNTHMARIMTAVGDDLDRTFGNP